MWSRVDLWLFCFFALLSTLVCCQITVFLLGFFFVSSVFHLHPPSTPSFTSCRSELDGGAIVLSERSDAVFINSEFTDSGSLLHDAGALAVENDLVTGRAGHKMMVYRVLD